MECEWASWKSGEERGVGVGRVGEEFVLDKTFSPS